MEKKPGTHSSGATDSGHFTYDPKDNPAKTKSNAIQVPSISLPKGGGAIKGIEGRKISAPIGESRTKRKLKVDCTDLMILVDRS